MMQTWLPSAIHISPIPNNREELPTPVADPGFSRGGCVNSQIGIILQLFGQKLHENERIRRPPLKSANGC